MKDVNEVRASLYVVVMMTVGMVKFAKVSFARLDVVRMIIVPIIYRALINNVLIHASVARRVERTLNAAVLIIENNAHVHHIL